MVDERLTGIDVPEGTCPVDSVPADPPFRVERRPVCVDGHRWDSGWNCAGGVVQHQKIVTPFVKEAIAGDGFLYEGRYYLLMLNYAASAIPPGIPPVAVNAHGPALDTEWWISRDGVNWARPFRHIDAGQAFVNHNPMIAEGQMLFHTENGLWAVPEDRITYVTARANGVFDTPQFVSQGRPMRLNARVPGGAYSSFQTQAYIMAELVDELDRVFQGYEKERCILQSELNAPN